MKRKLAAGWPRYLVATIAVIMSIYHLYYVMTARVEPLIHRSLHLTFGLILIFLLYKPFKKAEHRVMLVDLGLILLTLATFFYLYLNFPRIGARWRFVSPVHRWDIIFGLLVILIIFEAGRRTVGWPLVSVAAVFLLYTYFGPYLPGLLFHRGYTLAQVIEHMYLYLDGIFGIPIGVSSTYIFLFVLFGSFLGGSGAGDFFINFANAVAGKSRGGPAKVAILSSAVFGSISGSPVANVATTGAITIPLMKNIGYDPAFAAGVEAAASTGGVILPPVMGAVAFLMAEILGISYLDVIKAATIPAILYFCTLAIMVHLEALKTGLVGLSADKIPSLKKTLKEGSYYFLPLIGIIVILMNGYSASMAGVFGLLLTFLVSFFRRSSAMTPKKIVKAMEGGAKNSLPIIIACANAGLIIGSISLTGLGGKITSILLSFTGGYLILVMIAVMIICIILGMGMSITPTYIMAAVLGAPALTALGVERIAAHLFAIYFAAFCTITPPVALSSYTAAAISGSNLSKSSYHGLRLGLAGFLIPFIFAYRPQLLLMGSIQEIIPAVITAFLATFSLAAGIQNYLLQKTTKVERLILILGAILLFIPGLLTDFFGGLALLSIILFQYKSKGGQRAANF